jgi:hypothetical protein
MLLLNGEEEEDESKENTETAKRSNLHTASDEPEKAGSESRDSASKAENINKDRAIDEREAAIEQQVQLQLKQKQALLNLDSVKRATLGEGLNDAIARAKKAFSAAIDAKEEAARRQKDAEGVRGEAKCI